jgi:hypothetical protein
LTTQFKQQLDKAVADKKLSQARADELLKRFTDTLDQMIDRKHTPGAKPNRPGRAPAKPGNPPAKPGGNA